MKPTQPIAPSLPLNQAIAIVEAALAAAPAHQLAKIAVVVTDVGGAIRAGASSDNQTAFGFDIAHNKARTAIGFQSSSLRLAEFFSKNPSSTIGVTGVTGGQFLPIGGGIVILNADGQIVGGAAVAGGAPAIDHAVISAAVVAVGLKVLE